MSLGEEFLSDIVNGIDLDLAAGPGYTFETTEVLLREFDANVTQLRATCRSRSCTDPRRMRSKCKLTGD
jgi:hypothetical protein